MKDITDVEIPISQSRILTFEIVYPKFKHLPHYQNDPFKPFLFVGWKKRSVILFFLLKTFDEQEIVIQIDFSRLFDSSVISNSLYSR